MELKRITMNINGENRQVDVESNDILLDVLRDKLGIKSPKGGCGRGDCGSCTILLDGKSVRSCIILAVEADGSTIVTLEGLGRGRPHAVAAVVPGPQFVPMRLLRPGMILSAEELLRDNPTPDRHAIQEAIAGNLCRCTGYERIIEAIQDVADRNRTQE